MYLGLSLVSSSGLWVLLDSNFQIINHRSWKDELRGDLAKDLDCQLQSLLEDNSITLHSVKAIYCASGPGAYTGLRIAASYCLGLSLSLNIPLKPISTFALNSKTVVYIPIRHQLAAKTFRADYFSKKNPELEFLKITDDNSASLSLPKEDDCVWGFADDHCDWPAPISFANAIKNHQDSTRSFEIFYGLGPKVFGKYT